MKPCVDLYQEVTNRILQKLEQNVIPWKHFSFAPMSEPRNLVSGKPYWGINYLLLAVDGRFASPYWLTFKQALDRGGYVKKGEKGTPIVFWKFLDKENTQTGELERVPMGKTYYVFNVEQTENVQAPVVNVAPREVMPLEAALAIERGMPNAPTVVETDRPKAFYSPTLDRIHLCSACYCVSDERYHGTLLHELVHSTGHPSRLGRFEQDGCDHAFGSNSYSLEELVAEIGSAFLCAKAGIFQQVEDDQAAYVAHWLKALRQDKRMILTAAGKAQKAAAYILGDVLAPESPVSA